ncbi:MAG: putative toxin-antitoxin system toxin component, PIN family [Deltaproteobacteria bacterium]|nr:putative toxin-antitoxin system toxin component, PIN family [Deltaproteobacteria bacterium]
MKIVLDANVVIAAFASRGLCESVMELCLHSHEIVLSEELLEEIVRNLRQKIKLPGNIVEDISKLLREQASMVSSVPLAAEVCRDPDDVKILGLAVAANADYIVTGDKDLLVLKKFQGVPSVTPRLFSDIIHGEKN